MGPSSGAKPHSAQRVHYYLYHSYTREFTELRSLLNCGRLAVDLNFPQDDLMSKHHCQFSVVGDQIYVMDLGSTNGTRVNGVPIQSQKKRRIQLDDVIEFGSQRMVVTPQRSKAPGSSIDPPKNPRVYKAIRRKDGDLTRFLSGVFTNATAVVVDRLEFEKLRLQSFYRKRKRLAWMSLISLIVFLSYLVWVKFSQ